MDKDMFGQIVQDYETLKERAEQVFDIRGKHLKQYGTVYNIDITETTVEIETQDYYRGETDTHYYSFPAEYLLQSDEELHQLFAQERVREDERIRLEQERKRQQEQAKTEAYEREQLKKLLQKYGIPEDYTATKGEDK